MLTCSPFLSLLCNALSKNKSYTYFYVLSIFLFTYLLKNDKIYAVVLGEDARVTKKNLFYPNNGAFAFYGLQKC